MVGAWVNWRMNDSSNRSATFRSNLMLAFADENSVLPALLMFHEEKDLNVCETFQFLKIGSIFLKSKMFIWPN